MGELAVLDGGAPARSSVNLIEVARQAEAARALGATLIASGLLPDTIKRPEQAVLVILKGQELDLPPVYALSHLVVVKGKPTMSAELMRALVQRAGHKIRIVETTRNRAVVEGVRRDDPQHPVRITFDDEDVRIAGLANQGGHKNYPAALKLARATSMLCRALFADAIGGVGHTPEELGAEVDEEGEVLSVPDRGEATQRAEEPVEEAEVVEDQGGEELELAMRRIDEKLAEWPVGQPKPDVERVKAWALESAENARKAVARVERLRKDAEDAAAQEEAADAPSADEEEEAVPDFGDMRGAAREAPRPARKSQKDLIRTLVVELAGVDDGAERLEERRGIKIDELAFDEANDLIDELSPEDE